MRGLAGNDDLRGAAGDDFIEGNLGNDTLYGGRGSDYLLGLKDNDQIYGDTFEHEADEEDVDVALFPYLPTGFEFGYDPDTYAIPVLLVRGVGAQAAEGTDHIHSTVEYLTFVDSLSYPASGDQPGFNTISASINRGILLDYMVANGADNGIEWFSTSLIRVSGMANWASGSSASEFFVGSGAGDLVQAGDGDDVIQGGMFFESFIQGESSTAYEDSDVLNGGAGDDIIYGNLGDDIIDGGDDDDELYGGRGDDIVSGGAGNDRIWGNFGNDSLSGGAGVDSYYFAAGDGQDDVFDTDAANVLIFDAPQSLAGLSFSRSGVNLQIDYGSGDTVIVHDFYAAASDTAPFLNTFGGVSVDGGVTVTALTDLAPQPQALRIGETGIETSSGGNRSTWTQVTFSETIENAVVVAGPTSTNGIDPSFVRIRNVTDGGFEYQVSEWAYQDGWHGVESFSWAAISEGSWDLEGGRRIVGGQTQRDHNWWDVGFGEILKDAVVVAQATSYNGSDPVVTRIDQVEGDGFHLRLQEEEALGWHGLEDVSWIAVEAGTGGGVEAATPAQLVGDESGNADRFDFIDTYASAPSTIAAMQTFNGLDPATLRYTEHDASGFSAFVQDETSADPELYHADESLGYLAFAPGALFGYEHL